MTTAGQPRDTFVFDASYHGTYGEVLEVNITTTAGSAITESRTYNYVGIYDNGSTYFDAFEVDPAGDASGLNSFYTDLVGNMTDAAGSVVTTIDLYSGAGAFAAEGTCVMGDPYCSAFDASYAYRYLTGGFIQSRLNTQGAIGNTAVPLPASFGFPAAGLGAIGLMRRRATKKS